MPGILGALTANKKTRADNWLSAGLATMPNRGESYRWLQMDFASAQGLIGDGARRDSVSTFSLPKDFNCRLATDLILGLGGCEHISPCSVLAVAPDLSWVVVFDGRLDSRLALQEMLEIPADRMIDCTDAELVGMAYAKKGEACYRELEGAFAFGLYDAVRSRFQLVRDICGTHSLYYSVGNNQSVGFASTTKALVELTGQPLRVSCRDAMGFLGGKLYESGQHTMVHGIKQVEPGQVVSINLDGIITAEVSSYWQYPEVAACYGSYSSVEEASRTLQKKLCESIFSQARGSLGVALSSGIDSSSILTVLRSLVGEKTPISAFTFVAEGKEIKPEWNEVSQAQAVAKLNGADFYPVHLALDEVPEQLEVVIDSTDLPFVGPVVLAQRKVFADAKAAGVCTLFGGHGPDLLLGGGVSHVAWRLRNMLLLGQLIQAWRYLHFATVANRISRVSLLKSAIKMIPHETLRSLISKQLFQTVLPRTLWIEEQNAAEAGLTSRFPFLGREMIEFSLSLPVNYCVDDRGIPKFLLRESMRGRVPDLVLDRKGHVGFPVPVFSWIEGNQKVFRSLIEQAKLLPFGSARVLESLWQSALEGDLRGGYQIWRWISLVGWARTREVEFF